MTRSKKIKVVILAEMLLCLLNPLQSSTLQIYAQEAKPFRPYKGIPEGYEIIEGDILVPRYRIEGVYTTNFWPGGMVAYEFDTNVSAANQNLMLAAMAEWQAVANVQFFPRNGQVAYIHISDSDGNWSEVGYNGGRVSMGIFNWGWRFIMAHELGHALGMWHEQSRPDRDTYVTIEEDRIQSGQEHNFNRHDEADVYGPYDFGSVMHYDQCAFSTCSNCMADPTNCRTITVNPPWDTQWQSQIGQRTHLSVLDQLTMSFLYPEAGWVFVNRTYPLAPCCGSFQNGTFLNPFCEFTLAVALVSSGGTVIIQPGSYNAVGVYTKTMTVRAPLGGVVLGD